VRTAIQLYMRQKRWTRARLAQALDVTPGRVSQIMSGDENLTLRTLGALAAKLDAHFEVELLPNDALPAESAQPEPHSPTPRPKVPQLV